jgi:hypothetical protein
MAQSKKGDAKRALLEQLIADVQNLPSEQIAEVAGYIQDLRSRTLRQESERGSPEAILQALETTGPLEFEPGELDKLLAEIEALRELDKNG